MSSPCQSACSSWITEAELNACHPIPAGAEPATVIAAATDILYEMSGRKFPGSCLDVVPPCSRYNNAPARVWSMDDGLWAGWCGCNQGAACGCERLSEIKFGVVPITSIVKVKVDGKTLLPTQYRIDDYAKLVRLADPDGTNPGWPCCQRLDLDSDQPGTFEVEFTYGVGPPPAGVLAAVELSHELLLACAGAKDCVLSPRVQSVARQGVTIVFDRLTALRNDLTGLPAVDFFIRAFNPTGTRRPMRVFVPGDHPSVRRVGT